MPVPDERADDPVLCTICGHQFGTIGEYEDGETLECPECGERYEMVMPTQEEIDAAPAKYEAAMEEYVEQVSDPDQPNPPAGPPPGPKAFISVRTERLDDPHAPEPDEGGAEAGGGD